MARLYTKDGQLITDTVESVLITYGISGASRGPDGKIVVEYDDDSTVHWDTAEQLVRDGQPVYQTADGSEFLESDLELREDDEEEDK